MPSNMPHYIQQIYIWVLKMKQPLQGLDYKDMYTYVREDGSIIIIDVGSMNNFLKEYIIYDPTTNTNFV